MIPVATDHAPHVVDRKLLPRLIANVLPARNLFQYKQAKLVAGVEEVARLGIMRSTDNIALELLAKDLRAAFSAATRRSFASSSSAILSVLRIIPNLATSSTPATSLACLYWKRFRAGNTLAMRRGSSFRSTTCGA